MEDSVVSSEDRPATKESAVWLKDFLLSHRALAESLATKRAGEMAGHNGSALRRARKQLRVASRSVGFPRRTCPAWIRTCCRSPKLQPVPRLAPAIIENRLAEWRRLQRQSPTGRAVLQRVLRGRLTFTPLDNGQGYSFNGATLFDRRFSGVVVERPSFLTGGDMRGTAHLTAEDALEGDYGRLLERAHGKAVATLEGFEPSIFTLKG